MTTVQADRESTGFLTVQRGPSEELNESVNAHRLGTNTTKEHNRHQYGILCNQINDDHSADSESDEDLFSEGMPWLLWTFAFLCAFVTRAVPAVAERKDKKNQMQNSDEVIKIVAWKARTIGRRRLRQTTRRRRCKRRHPIIALCSAQHARSGIDEIENRQRQQAGRKSTNAWILPWLAVILVVIAAIVATMSSSVAESANVNTFNTWTSLERQTPTWIGQECTYTDAYGTRYPEAKGRLNGSWSQGVIERRWDDDHWLNESANVLHSAIPTTSTKTNSLANSAHLHRRAGWNAGTTNTRLAPRKKGRTRKCTKVVLDRWHKELDQGKRSNNVNALLDQVICDTRGIKVYRRYGEAKNPGPTEPRDKEKYNMLDGRNSKDRPKMAGLLKMITANVFALRPKAKVVAAWDADVILLQETKLAASVIADVREDFEEQGKSFHHGKPCKAGTRSSEVYASSAKQATKGGVAMALRRPRTSVNIKETTVAKELKSTGRWNEVVVPAGADTTHIGFGNVYGHSRASSDARCYRENETLLARAITRPIEFGDVPYVIAGDININPACSETVAAAVEAGILSDIGYAARVTNPQPTYRRSGPFKDMLEDDANVSRLDVVLANPAATAAVKAFRPRWDLTVADHVPLEVEFAVDDFTKDTMHFDGPKPITIAGIPEVSDEIKTFAYRKARNL